MFSFSHVSENRVGVDKVSDIDVSRGLRTATESEY